MSGRAAWRAPLALLLGLAMTGVVAAQANAPQTIRYGTVVSMEETIVQVEQGGSGAQVGATVGAVAGYALSDGGDRWLGGLVGGVLGGAAGGAAQKKANKKKGYQLIVRLEETGEEIGIQVAGKKQDYREGDRVRMLTAPGGQTQVSKAKG